MFGLVALITVSISAAPTDNEAAGINCLIKHLKGMKKLPASFPEHSGGTFLSSSDCDSVITEIKKDCYKEIALMFRIDTDFNVHTKCIMADLRTHNMLEETLLMRVYEMSESLTASEKKKKISEVGDNVENIMKEALISCIYKQAMKELSEDTINNKNIDLGDTKMMDYCGKKRIIDNGLIDTTVYKINLNPDNLDVEGVDCDAVLKSKIRIFVKHLYELLQGGKKFDKDVFDCFVKKFKESKYFNRLMVLGIMAELDLSEEEKAAEVQKFIDFMKELTYTVANCK